MSTSTSTPAVPNSASQHHPTTTTTSSSDFSSHPTTTAGYAPNDNQLAGLVEAATAAAGQDVSEWAEAAAVAAAGATENHHQLDGYEQDMHIGDGDGGFGTDAGFGGMSSSSGKRFKGSTAVGHDSSSGDGGGRAAARKRKREEDPLDPALAAASAGVGFGQQQQQQQQQEQRQQPGQHEHHQHSGLVGDDLDTRVLPPQSASEIHTAGIPSAAALFRQPSGNKRYTRPPISRMFSSLELSPENFLHLQAAAKAYMLDDNHPERRDCVGQRGKGDTEMVKLRLWNCVRTFLETEGNGERFFGENVVNEDIGPRTHVWPRDQQRIISLVIPLLRRMVTNERQRRYAVETRRGGGPEERRRRKTEDSLHDLSPSQQYTPEEQLQMHHNAQDHQLPGAFASQHPPALPPQQPQVEQASPAQGMELGLTNLFVDGYQTDWNELARSYDMYNRDYELDNLWSISGLQQPDWRGLVAAVDSHYQVVHHGGYECPPICEDENIQRIISSDSLSDLQWRIGGNRNQPVRNEFASSITRDVSRVIRDILAARSGSGDHPMASSHAHPPSSSQAPLIPTQHFGTAEAAGGTFQPSTNENSQYITTNANSGPAVPTTTTTTTTATPSSSSLILRISLLHNNKRILSPLTISADQCPDLETLKQLISRRYAGQLPLPSDTFGSVSHSAWRVKVLLPDGLISVTSDGEWTVALLSAEDVDWMDGDLRVLVDVG